MAIANHEAVFESSLELHHSRIIDFQILELLVWYNAYPLLHLFLGKVRDELINDAPERVA